jgi:hypothetical protein
MPNQRSRNSRDDKSGPNKRTTRATGGRKPASSEKPAFGEKKNFGDDKKSFGPKKREFGANREEKPKDFTPKTGRSDFKKEGYSSIRTTSSRTPREGGDSERRPYNSSPRPFKRDGEGSASYYTLSFTVEFSIAKDTCLIAYSYPYTLSDHKKHLQLYYMII